MDINRFNWMLALILIVAPVAVVGLLKLVSRKRGGSSGWGGMLFIGLCWLIAMLAILDRVR